MKIETAVRLISQMFYSPFRETRVWGLRMLLWVGGTNTSSTLLEWEMSELLSHPECLKRLQEEVRTVEDVNLRGYHIPAGTQVMINLYAVGREVAIWGLDTDDFKPERHLNSSVDFLSQNFELIPFGAGRRMCPSVTARFLAQKFLKESLLGLRPTRVNDLGFPPFPINKAVSSLFSLILKLERSPAEI
ncbi:hypothetical protein F2Q70_00017328 [Brassica cretica]|uniref:Cytochrome P450 n=1 Tax=Brassica cretica TaxID=69181 RepID=A0A8S9I4W7_BRACR|nr:hypothetical protein F2Q70_00017328 [Brassica cretica]